MEVDLAGNGAVVEALLTGIGVEKRGGAGLLPLDEERCAEHGGDVVGDGGDLCCGQFLAELSRGGGEMQAALALLIWGETKPRKIQEGAPQKGKVDRAG